MSAMQMKGLIKAEAFERIMMFDTQGVVVTERPSLAAEKVPFADKLPASKKFNHLSAPRRRTIDSDAEAPHSRARQR
jgi:hypothetical protein